MKFTPFSRWAFLCILDAVAPVAAFAQQTAPAAEIQNVDFKQAKVNGVKLPMTRMAVAVRALNNAKLLQDPNAIVPNKDYVDKIKVTVTLAYSSNSGKAKKGQQGSFSYYRSAQTILTMQRNDQGTIYFYLPGEIVKRESLQVQPFAWLIELEVDGQAVPLEKKMCSSNLRNPSEVALFKQAADAGVIDNAGILRPQFQVPGDEAVQNLSPTLLREDTTNL